MLRKASIRVGSLMGKLNIVQQPAQVLQRIRHALQEMCFALVESTESIRAERLHDADVNVGIVVLHEGVAVERYVTRGSESR